MMQKEDSESTSPGQGKGTSQFVSNIGAKEYTYYVHKIEELSMENARLLRELAIAKTELLKFGHRVSFKEQDED